MLLDWGFEKILKKNQISNMEREFAKMDGEMVGKTSGRLVLGGFLGCANMLFGK